MVALGGQQEKVVPLVRCGAWSQGLAEESSDKGPTEGGRLRGQWAQCGRPDIASLSAPKRGFHGHPAPLGRYVNGDIVRESLSPASPPGVEVGEGKQPCEWP